MGNELPSKDDPKTWKQLALSVIYRLLTQGTSAAVLVGIPAIVALWSFGMTWLLRPTDRLGYVLKVTDLANDYAKEANDSGILNYMALAALLTLIPTVALFVYARNRRVQRQGKENARLRALENPQRRSSLNPQAMLRSEKRAEGLPLADNDD